MDYSSVKRQGLKCKITYICTSQEMGIRRESEYQSTLAQRVCIHGISR